MLLALPGLASLLVGSICSQRIIRMIGRELGHVKVELDFLQQMRNAFASFIGSSLRSSAQVAKDATAGAVRGRTTKGRGTTTGPGTAGNTKRAAGEILQESQGLLQELQEPLEEQMSRETLGYAR